MTRQASSSAHVVDAVAPAAAVQEDRCDAFAVFYRRWRSQLLAHVARANGMRDAEEITQETMTRAYESIDFARDERSQWAWLRVVARNAATDLARSRRLCDVTVDEDHEGYARPAHDDVEQQLLDSECLATLRNALSTLPPKQGRAWWLTVAEGLPPTAIAASMSCSPESVRQALFKSRRRLASTLAFFCDRLQGIAVFPAVVSGLRAIRRGMSDLRRPIKTSAAMAASVSAIGALLILQGSVPPPAQGQVRSPSTESPTAQHAGYAVPRSDTQRVGETRARMSAKSSVAAPSGAQTRRTVVGTSKVGDPALVGTQRGVTVTQHDRGQSLLQSTEQCLATGVSIAPAHLGCRN